MHMIRGYGEHKHAEESKEIGKGDTTNGDGIQGLRNPIEDRKGKRFKDEQQSEEVWMC